MLFPTVAGTTSSVALAGPTASAGAAAAVLTSLALVSLDGSASSDPLGSGLTYSWTMDIVPAGSASTLVDATTSTPDFTPDLVGAYSGVLTVTDGREATDTIRWLREVRRALTVSIAAVSNIDSLAAVALNSTLDSAGVGTVTYAWTLTGPDGTDQSALLDDDTIADPTADLTSIAAGQQAGRWTASVTATDAAGQTATDTVQWEVGQQVALGAGYVWMLLVEDIDVTAAATDDYTDADGSQTLGGLTWTSRNGVAGADTFGVLNGTGLQFAPAVNKVFNATTRNCPMLDIDVLGALPDWTRRTPFAVQIVYTWTTAPAANICHLRLFASDTTPTTVSGGENIIACMDEYSGGVVRSVSNTIRNGAGGNQNTAAGPSQGLELLYDGTGFNSGYSTSDPGSAVVAPGTWTRHPTSATAGDTGRIPWSTRSSGTAPVADSAHRVGMAFSRDATGTAIAGHVRHIRFWMAA